MWRAGAKPRTVIRFRVGSTSCSQNSTQIPMRGSRERSFVKASKPTRGSARRCSASTNKSHRGARHPVYAVVAPFAASKTTRVRPEDNYLLEDQHSGVHLLVPNRAGGQQPARVWWNSARAARIF
ncbi:hypothetical protein BIW11_10908 [Tropilaelaps mercedesae]|uniref:Uncharacterized protein n=1 Tax=Tropilaelaps mercedesae TaxID=418985 RepID=A0A1V9XE14_9ACAR|nr:hypothetical protein BIW11_10908 [Tropilaelaps mercedesae]